MAAEFASLEGRTALVTGASKGIGRAIAEELARAGASVAVGYRSGREEAEALASEVGGRAIQADVSSPEDAKRLVEEAGDVDILVNNAGLTRDTVLARMSDDDWRVVLGTNLDSVFYMCRAVSRPMMRRRGGAIVNVSSIVGVHGNFGQANYAASKAGVAAFTKSLAKELAGKGVTVNALAPGFIETEMVESIPEKVQAKLLEQIPLRRFGRAEEVGRAVTYLVSQDGDYITGAELSINGGLLM